MSNLCYREIIANEEVLNVSQTYAGHGPGYLVANSSDSSSPRSSTDAAAAAPITQTLPMHEVWAKPQPRGKLAVLVVNVGVSTLTLTLRCRSSSTRHCSPRVRRRGSRFAICERWLLVSPTRAAG